MWIKSGLVGFGAATLVATAAWAAPATPEQAAAVKSGLERYVGNGSGGTSPVAVTPEGDHYTIALDLKQALHGLETFGLTVDAATYAMTATPTEAGTWHVTSGGLPRLTVKHGEDSYSVVVNGMSFDGIFDPKVIGFQSSTMSYESMSVAVVGRTGGTQTREINRGKQTSMATVTGDGTANVQVAQSNEGFSQDVNLDMPGPNGAPGKVSVKSASTSANLAVDDLHSRAVADLWAFFVAHTDATAIKGSQAELKDLLRKALPLFDRWTQGGSAERLIVEGPFGAFTADHVGAQLRTTGLVADGRVESEIRYDGASFPSGLIPGWAENLVPTSAVVKDSFSGFHLEGAARKVVNSFDLNAKDPLSPEVTESLKGMLGPLDQMVATLLPSHIESKLLKIDLDGDMHLTQPMPDFHVNVRASGLDKALQDIQSKAGGDKNASQLIAVLLLAKGLGKGEPDGSLSWAVTKGDADQILVNGLSLPGAGK